MPKINGYRSAWAGGGKAGTPHTKDLALDSSKWDKADKDYIQKFFCDRIKMTYREQYFWDPVGVGVWNERLDFDLRCYFHPVINDKIRIIFEMPVRDPNYGATYTNTSPDQGRRPETVTLKDRRTVTYIK